MKPPYGLLLLTFAVLCGSLSSPEPVVPVTTFLVRHAETAEDTKTHRDPGLSDGGQERADALARLLGSAGVTHLFASEFVRTQATLEPLAQHGDLEIQVISAREPEKQLEALAALPPGSIAVVSGHSNTVPGLVGDLTGTPMESIEHGVYDRLFVLTIPGNDEVATRAVELRYGD